MLSRREGHDYLLQLPETGSFHLSYGYMQILLFFKKKKNPRLALAALECHVMNGNRNCALVSGPLSQHAVFGVYSGFIVHPFLLLSVCQYVVYRHTTT